MKFKDLKLGATKKFPYGRIDADDEGELRMAIAADPHAGIVRLEFGKAVAWLGLPSQHARELGRMLIEKADELDRRKA